MLEKTVDPDHRRVSDECRYPSVRLKANDCVQATLRKGRATSRASDALNLGDLEHGEPAM
jgi:hypothetical protein